MTPASEAIARPAPPARGRHNPVAAAGFLACAAIVALASSPPTLEAQQVRGRVVDLASRQAIPGAFITLLGADGAIVTRDETGDDGFFTLEALPGTYTVTVESVGYAPGRRPIEIRNGNQVVPAFTLHAQAVQLESVDVEADARDPIDDRTSGSSRYVLAGERLANLERHGIPFPAALRQLDAGLRVTEWIGPSGQPYLCVRATRNLPSFSGRRESGDCDWPALIIDGAVVGINQTVVRSLDIRLFESIEFLTGTEAHQRYGLIGGAAGALVLWTRGRGPHVDARRSRG
jgi:hypothetical protein